MILSISNAARLLGVCTKTLRRWDATGVNKADYRTCGGHRRYKLEHIEQKINKDLKNCKSTILQREYKDPRNSYRVAAVYARVSATKQKEDLIRQVDYLRTKAEILGYQSVLIYKDIASGINDRRNGLLNLIKDAFKHKFDILYITHTDRLARFGISLIYQVLQYLNIPIECIGPIQEASESLEYTLVNDVLAILTSYSGKLYRLRRGSFS